MGKVFISPNLHVILIHYPLGVFVLGLLIELCSFLYRRSTLRTAGWWMILLGALATIPTAYSGIYALDDVAYRSQEGGKPPANQPWAQVAAGARLHGGPADVAPAAPQSRSEAAREQPAEAWQAFRHHVWRQSFATGIVALTAVFALGASDRLRRRLYLPIMALLLGGAGLMASGAWYGGEAVYSVGGATRLQKAWPPVPAAGARAVAVAPAPSPVHATSPTTAASGESVPSPGPAFSSLASVPSFRLSPTLLQAPTTEPSTEPTTAPATVPTTVPATVPTTAPSTEPATGPATAPTTEPSTEPGPPPAQVPATAPAPSSAGPAESPAPPLPTTGPATVPAVEGPETTPTTAPTTVSTPPHGASSSEVPRDVFSPLGQGRAATGPTTSSSAPTPAAFPAMLPATTSIGVPREAREGREARERIDEAEEELKPGTVAYYVGPPLQIHVILAGVVTAISLGAFGASMRRLSLLAGAPHASTNTGASIDVPTEVSAETRSQAVAAADAVAEAQSLEMEAALAATYAPGHRPTTERDIDLVRSINPGLTVVTSRMIDSGERVPAARLWLLAFAIALLTASVGVYFLAAPRHLMGEETGWSARILWAAIIDKQQNHDGPLTRRLAHVIAGGTILLLPLILAMLARWSRSRALLALISLLLAAAVAAQVWLGVLLLYDTNVGKITQMNPPPEAPRESATR